MNFNECFYDFYHFAIQWLNISVTNVNLCSSWSQTKGQEIKEKIYIPFAFAFTELSRALLPFESFQIGSSR